MEHHFTSLKDQFTKHLAEKILVKVEDLSENEKALIEHSFALFIDKMEDIKTLNDELKRLTTELLNLKSMHDDRDYE